MRLFHLSHHQGCIADIEYVCQDLGIDLESACFDDGYNIGPERADRAWDRWHPRFADSDAVLVSDTAPLARIILQHLDDFPGHLVIWICNRFDYADAATDDCGFPDTAYYELFRRSIEHPRVHVAAYNAFEHVWARLRGVDTGTEVIRPLGLRLASGQPGPSLLPTGLNRADTVFVPPYHNDTRLIDLAEQCERLGIRAYSGRYGGAADLEGFRAIIHIPYAWSNFAFFEHLQAGIPVFIPSRKLLFKLRASGDFWWPQADLLDRHLELAEWYSPDNEFLLYFRSWRDLRRRLRQTDLELVRSKMRSVAVRHREAVLGAWKALFDAIPSASPTRGGRGPASEPPGP